MDVVIRELNISVLNKKLNTTLQKDDIKEDSNIYLENDVFPLFPLSYLSSCW